MASPVPGISALVGVAGVADEQELVRAVARVMTIGGLLVAIIMACFKQRAAYGRYASTAFGPLLPGKLAWFTQELPSWLVPVALAGAYGRPECLASPTNLVLLGMFLLHYSNRTWVFPFLLRGGKGTPLVTWLMATGFCLVNGYIQGRTLTALRLYPAEELVSVPVLAGVAVFLTGMVINVHSDSILRNLRKPGETGYKIPRGGMFEFVSGANFLGECLEWTGFAIACRSWPATAFAVFTIANIGPRAFQHHAYYKDKFDDYPTTRKALIPFLF